MADVQAVLERCDQAFLDPYGDAEQPECVESDRVILYLMDSRRIQKVLWRQLSVLDSMMSLLEGLESSQQLLKQHCPKNIENKAHARWKALKAETVVGVQETEALISVLQGRLEQIRSKRNRLTQLVQELRDKKEKREQLEGSLQKAQNALRVCGGQLTSVRAEVAAVLDCLANWQLVRDELHGYVSATQDVMQSNLLSVDQSELCIEQRPRLCGSLGSSELEPLKLTVSLSPCDRFKLQVHQSTAGVEEECMKGRLMELSADLLEVMQHYTSQGDMLAEIQSLHSSFAIDWNPAQRLLVYLKSASVMCSLLVEDGYPSSGRAKLQSIRRDMQAVDVTALQPPRDNMSVTEWLLFLSCSPLV